MSDYLWHNIATDIVAIWHSFEKITSDVEVSATNIDDCERPSHLFGMLLEQFGHVLVERLVQLMYEKVQPYGDRV